MDFSSVTEQPVKLDDQLSKAFTNEEFSDVTLACDEKQFPCQKGTLAKKRDITHLKYIEIHSTRFLFIV